MDTRMTAPIRRARPEAGPGRAPASTPGGVAAAGEAARDAAPPLSAARLLRKIRLPSNATPFLVDTSVEQAFRAAPRASDVKRWVASDRFDPDHRDAAGRNLWNLLADCAPITGDDIADILSAAVRKGLRTRPDRDNAPSSMLPLDRAVARGHVALIYAFLRYGDGFGRDGAEGERRRRVGALVRDRRAASDEPSAGRSGARSFRGLLGRSAARGGARGTEGDALDRIEALIAAEGGPDPSAAPPSAGRDAAARGAAFEDAVEDVALSIRSGAPEEAIAKLRALAARRKSVRFAPGPRGA